MNIKPRSRTGLTVLVALLAITAVAIPAFGALTVDTETTETSTQSDWSQDTSVDDLVNDSKTATIQVNASNATASNANENFKLYLMNNDTNRTFHSTAADWSGVSGGAETYEYNVTFGTVFETLERDASDNVTVDVKVVYNESESDEQSTTFQIFANNDETNAVIASTGENDSATIQETSGFLSSLSGNDSTEIGAARVSDELGVNQTSTESIIVALDDEDLETSFSRVADKDSGSLALTAYAEIEDKTIPVFPQSAENAGWLDTSTQTYATVNSAGDKVEIHNANDSLESSNVTVSVTGDEMIGATNAYGMLRDYGASATTSFTISLRAIDFNGQPDAFDDGSGVLAGVGLLLAFGIPALRRRRRD